MNIKIDKAKLLSGLESVIGIIKQKTSIQIIGNVSLIAHDGKLRFCATNLDSTIVTERDCSMIEPGATTVRADKLYRISREVISNEIELSCDKKNILSITAGDAGESHYKINGISIDEFPPTPEPEKDEISYSVPSDSFLRAIRLVSYAQSEDVTRYTICGIYMAANNGDIDIVATDGRRVAITSIEISKGDEEKSAFAIVPSDSIKELKKLSKIGNEVEINFSNKMIRFRFQNESHDEETIFFSKKVDGNFPTYKNVIPPTKSIVARIPINREEFLGSIRRASILLDKETGVNFVIKHDSITAMVDSRDGIANDIVQCKSNIEGVTTLNFNYLIEPLSALDCEEIKFAYIDPTSPIELTSENFLYIVMPMRTPEDNDNKQKTEKHIEA